MKCNFQGLVWLTMLVWTVSAPAATRVALVNTCGGDAGADVLALAEAKLSQQAEIVLVERREVERVLQEQKLAVCGRSSYAQALTVGKLLSVDVFAALETFPGSVEALGMVVFNAVNGTRLWDQVLPEKAAEDRAQAIVAVVQGACEKNQRQASALQTVCLLAVRNADLPGELDNFCAPVGRLLEIGLASSSGLTVLERQRLEQINRERSLTAHPAPSGLLPALTLLEIGITRGSNSQGLAAIAFLTDAAGRELAQVKASTPRVNVADLADALLGEITKVLHAAPVRPSGDRGREATRFQQESKFLLDRRDYQGALTDAEAAFALDPEDREFYSILLRCLVGLARQKVYSKSPADWERSLILAQRAFDFVEQYPTTTPTQFVNHSDQLPGAGNDRAAKEIVTWGLEYYLKEAIRLDTSQQPDIRRRLAALQEQCLLRFLRPIELARTGVHDPQGFLRYTSRLNWAITGIIRLSQLTLSSEEWTTLSLALFTQWLTLVDQYPPSSEWTKAMQNQGGFLSFLIPQIGQPASRMAAYRPPRWQFTMSDGARWREFFCLMERQCGRVLQLRGKLGNLWVDLNTRSVSVVDADRRVDLIVEFAKEQIAQSDLDDVSRALTYSTALAAIEFFSSADQQANARLDLFELMSTRSEVSADVLQAVYSPQLRSRIEQLLMGSQTHFLDRDRSQIEHQYRHDLYPEARPAPWTQARVLFDGPRFGVTQIANVFADTESAYLVGNVTENDRPFVQLFRMPLTDGTPVPLGKAELTRKMQMSPGLARFYEGNFYIPAPSAGRDGGLIVLPRDGGTAQYLTSANGWPAHPLSTFTLMDGKIYGALEGGYIVVRDLQTGQTDILAASGRRDAQSPLDNSTPPFHVSRMIVDNPRHRVLFTIDRGPRQLEGLWEIDGQGKLRQRLENYTSGSGLGLLGPAGSEQHFYLMMRPYFVRFDLTTDQAQVLYAGTNSEYLVSAKSPTGMALEEARRTGLPCQIAPFTATAEAPKPSNLPPEWLTSLFVDDWFWMTYPFGRISADGQTNEIFPPLELIPDQPPSSYWIYPQLIGNGRQILVAHGRQLWLLTLPPKAAKNPP